MIDLLFRLLGARVDETGSVVAMQFEVQPAVGWGTWLVLAAIVVGVAGWSYWRRDVPLAAWRRGILLALRIGALLVLAAVLLRPGLALTVEGLVRQTLTLLFDQSASLALRDPRTETADDVRAAIAEGSLSATGGLEQRPAARTDRRPMRLDLLRAVLTNRELALIERMGQGFDLEVAGFAGELLALPVSDRVAASKAVARGDTGWTPSLAAALGAAGRETAPGTALRELLERERGRSLGGVVLFTDGIRNRGVDPRDAAELAREAGVAIHVVGLGTTRPRDLQVIEVLAPDVAFARDEVGVSARLRARGMAGQSVRVTLSLDGVAADARDVSFDEDGESVVPLKVTPEQIGDFELTVDVPVRADEILAENNRQARRLRVVDDRVRVLWLEQSPRWEFRYLQALLLRDRRVALKCILFDGDPAITRGTASPYLESFPTRREELFAYDLVVFGDVDPRNFTPAQLEMLADFVARSGGSFLMVAGRRFSPWSYRDTALERLLPVEFERTSAAPTAGAVYDRPEKLELTAAGRSSPLLRLADESAENLRQWEALAPLFWIAPVRRAKPAAEVLVTGADRGDGATPVPVLAGQQYGVGQSMFLGTDNTWRWRRNEGEQFYEAFWGRMVQRLAIHHLLSGSRRTQLKLDRVSVLPRERISVTARLFTSAFEPLTEATVVVRIDRDVRGASDTPTAAEFSLRAVPDQPGLYQGELLAPDPGRYRLRVGEDATAAVDFTVEDRLVEAGETAMQEGALRELAAITGGEFFREEDLHRLPDVVQGRAQRVRSRLTIDLWSSPLWYLLALTLLGTEWSLRKWWQLK